MSSLAQFELNPDGTGTPSREAFRAELRSQWEPLRDAFIDVAGVTPEEWVEDSAEQPQPARALDAAWYRDPEGEARLRHLDGKDWTERTA